MRAVGPAWLFSPADKPQRFGTAAARADLVIADLEDGVAPIHRPAARRGLVAADLDPSRTVVRVNAADTEDCAADLAAVQEAGLRVIMLPKAESAGDIARVSDAGGFDVIALCESATGVARAEEIARAPRCVRLMWGSEDLAASLGMWTSRDASGLLPTLSWARSAVLVAARAAGVLAIDAVHTRWDELDALGSEALQAAAAGFDAKACIHPQQIDVIRAAFRPPRGIVEDARRMLEAGTEGGAIAIGGGMVDEAVLRRARRIIRAAGES